MTLSEPDHLDEISLLLFREWLQENPVTYDELQPYIGLFLEVVSINVEKKVIMDELAQRY